VSQTATAALGGLVILLVALWVIRAIRDQRRRDSENTRRWAEQVERTSAERRALDARARELVERSHLPRKSER